MKKWSRKKIYLAVSIVLVVLGLGAVIVKKRMDAYAYKTEVRKYLSLGNGNQIVIESGDGDIRFTPKYMVASEIFYSKAFSYIDYSINNIKKDNYNRVTVYSATKSNHKIKTIDVLALTRKYKKNYIPTDLVSSMAYDGKNYYLIYTVANANKPRFDIESVSLNIETEEIKPWEPDNQHPKNILSAGLISYIFSPKVTNVQDKLARQNIELDVDKDNDMIISGVKFNAKSKIGSLNLVKEYPKSKPYLLEGGELCWYDDKDTKTLAKLLGTTKETDVFQGVTLYGKYAKDGKDHKVSSYDDLMTWYQEKSS